MNERDFKKLLIDLNLSITDIALAVGVSRTAVRKYFRGQMHKAERRAAIKAVLAQTARKQKVQLPLFWQQKKAT